MSETIEWSEPYRLLREALAGAELLGSVAGVLSWDQETMLPPRGAALRAEQMALLGTLVHERQTSPQIGEWLSACEADSELMADAAVAANLREIRRGYERAVLLPGTLVHEMAETTSLALQAWRDARERSDFASFAPWLEKVFHLSRAQAECYGGDTPAARYDALMDGYEPGARSAEVQAIFDDLRARLTPLIRDAAERDPGEVDRLHRVEVPIDRQVEFNQFIAKSIGFDLDAGRLDTSTHPFCQGIGPGDTRLTTRYRVDAFTDALTSTLHEGGHGLYEQGLPKSEYPGQPLSEPASLGIHESQSRLWENMIGRSEEFWTWALPLAAEQLSPEFAEVTPQGAFTAMNRVRPNLIRVESDEATYNLHIMLRFDLERALLSGDLSVADLPGEWNARMLADLGLNVPDDRRGVLQDVHWAMGAIGYFPTYTLGNLYAAQLWETISHELPDLGVQVARGDFGLLLQWLREKVHRHGRRFTAGELCERVTGSPLSPEPLLRYLRTRIA